MFSNILGSKNTSYTNGSNGSGSIVEQLVYGLIYAGILFLVFMFVELMYKYWNRLSMNRTILVANTINSDKTISIPQNPNASGSNTVSLSSNERTGVEFSYSFYLNVNPSTFQGADQTTGLYHIFHKGYASQFPLMAPGVYMRSDQNTLRIYMNTYKTWNNYIDVENIPVSKWVHVVIVCKEHALEIYVNGNIAKKMSFDGFSPYQNYQDICCFSNRRVLLSKSKVASLGDSDFNVLGAMKGLMSRLTYFSYGLGYSEIQQLLNQGPSDKMDSSQSMDIPPYMADNWWTQSK
jgi:hypothetical protein